MLKRNRNIILMILTAVFMTACGQKESAVEERMMPTPTPVVETDPVEELLASMTTQQKVAQLFIVQPEALQFETVEAEINSANTNGVKVLTDGMKTTLQEIPVGGIAFFGSNIESSEQIKTLVNDFQSASQIPLFTAIDEEGGIVARLASHSEFGLPTYRSAGAVGSQGMEAVEEMYHAIGHYLSDYGMNLDFAPVADVNSNPNNPVIGTRSFATTAEEAGPLVASAVKGLKEEGVLSTLKHFPGHGDTASDSHTGAVYVNATMSDLYQREFVPFEAGISAGAQFVMVGHINTPNATSDQLPASLSYTMMTEVLRNDLGFEGLIITDALAMRAISDYYPSDEAAILSFLAGTDILLMPYDFAKAYQGMCDAVSTGRITQERLDESVYRILKTKYETGILSFE